MPAASVCVHFSLTCLFGPSQHDHQNSTTTQAPATGVPLESVITPAADCESSWPQAAQSARNSQSRRAWIIGVSPSRQAARVVPLERARYLRVLSATSDWILDRLGDGARHRSRSGPRRNRRKAAGDGGAAATPRRRKGPPGPRRQTPVGPSLSRQTIAYAHAAGHLGKTRGSSRPGGPVRRRRRHGEGASPARETKRTAAVLARAMALARKAEVYAGAEGARTVNHCAS